MVYVLNNAELYIYEELNHINKLYAKNYLINILFYNNNKLKRVVSMNNMKEMNDDNKRKTLKHVVSMNNMIEMNDDNKRRTLKHALSLDNMEKE